MKETIARFRAHVLEQLDALEKDILRTKADWEQKKGAFGENGYVFRENLCVFEEELAGVKRTREIIQKMDVSSFQEVADFKTEAIRELKELYDGSVLIRSGISIIIGIINRLDNCARLPPSPR